MNNPVHNVPEVGSTADPIDDGCEEVSLEDTGVTVVEDTFDTTLVDEPTKDETDTASKTGDKSTTECTAPREDYVSSDTMHTQQREIIPQRKLSRVPMDKHMKSRVKWICTFLLGFGIAYGITWAWPLDAFKDMPICPNTDSWIEIWVLVADVLESLYFGLGFAFTCVVLPKVYRMSGKLRRKIGILAVCLSFFMLTWFFHGRLHETFCGYWGIVFLDIAFHIPIAVMSLLIMKYCMLLMRRLQYPQGRHGQAQSRDFLTRTQWIVVSIVILIITPLMTVVAIKWLPVYVAEAPPPPPCGYVYGCPVLQCEIPPFCTDFMCPELAASCPLQSSLFTAEQCYQGGETNPVTQAANSETLVNECTANSAQYPCNPDPGFNFTECQSLPFDPSAPNCTRPDPNTPPPETCMYGGLANMGLPQVLPQCDMDEIENVCMICSTYRNIPPQLPQCFRGLDSGQMPWDAPDSLETVFFYVYTVFDAALFGAALCFGAIAVPLACRLPNDKYMRTKFLAFTLSICWLCGSWIWHGIAHMTVEKPMKAWKWLSITICFHYTTMLCSAIVVYCMWEIITMSYEYSKSEFRSKKTTDMNPSSMTTNKSMKNTNKSTQQSHSEDNMTQTNETYATGEA